MIEGSGARSGSVHRTSGSRSGRPKNIRIRNTAYVILVFNLGTCDPTVMNHLGDGTDGEGNADEAKTGEGGGGPHPGQFLHFIF
jgi:hypothetical protein